MYIYSSSLPNPMAARAPGDGPRPYGGGCGPQSPSGPPSSKWGNIEAFFALSVLWVFLTQRYYQKVRIDLVINFGCW